MLGLDSGSFAQLQARVDAQDRVRIQTRSGEWLIITRPNLTAKHLETAADSPVELRYVSLIQVRGNSAGKGAMVGAGIGFVPGFVAGWALAGFCFNLLGGDCPEPERLRVGVTVGAVGATIGGLLGAAIGAVPLWKTVYARDRASPLSARLLLTPHSRGGVTLGASVRF
ncbi:MAG TPA: hypothetical protein VJL31_08875 [Gemmatimonadales bacterium]|jgi:hypothetical protein|nr:hypothetical protein [Gemmatimonadales bacterium]